MEKEHYLGKELKVGFIILLVGFAATLTALKERKEYERLLHEAKFTHEEMCLSGKQSLYLEIPAKKDKKATTYYFKSLDDLLKDHVEEEGIDVIPKDLIFRGIGPTNLKLADNEFATYSGPNLSVNDFTFREKDPEYPNDKLLHFHAHFNASRLIAYGNHNQRVIGSVLTIQVSPKPPTAAENAITLPLHRFLARLECDFQPPNRCYVTKAAIFPISGKLNKEINMLTWPDFATLGLTIQADENFKISQRKRLLRIGKKIGVTTEPEDVLDSVQKKTEDVKAKLPLLEAEVDTRTLFWTTFFLLLYISLRVIKGLSDLALRPTKPFVSKPSSRTFPNDVGKISASLLNLVHLTMCLSLVASPFLYIRIARDLSYIKPGPADILSLVLMTLGFVMVIVASKLIFYKRRIVMIDPLELSGD